MTQPRPSRRARWAIGFSVTAVLAFAAMIFGLIGFVAAVGDGTLGDGLGPDTQDARATATVLDVDAYSYDDEPVPLNSDWASDDGYAEVDIDFMAATVHAVTMLDWPTGRPLPKEGDRLEIAYDSSDPEYSPVLADEVHAPGVPKADQSDGPPPVWPALATIISGSLALLALLGTVIWARRAQPEPVVPVDPGWSQPGWSQPGWSQPGWSQQGWSQPGWSQQPSNQPPDRTRQPPGRQPGPSPSPEQSPGQPPSPTLPVPTGDELTPPN
jgi:hypothetical protein